MTTTNIALPQCWQDVEDALRAGIDRLILFGPSGTGKTYAGLTLGNVSAGAHRLICNEDMTSADITGHYKPGKDSWQWKEGAVIKAWNGDGINGGRVVADEINKASGDVLSLLLAMFDSVESASWEDPESGRTLRPRPGFSVVMTTNVEDMRELPDALKDRFPVAIRINEPHPGGIARLSPDLRAAAIASADAERGRRFSLRAFLAFDQMRKSLPNEQAARLAFGERAYKSILDAIAVNGVS